MRSAAHRAGRAGRAGRVIAVAAALSAALVLGADRPLTAQGHGPVYGLSTPTLGEGGWSLDVGAMGRVLQGGRAAMLRPMLSGGITEDLQAFGSVPIPLQTSSGFPPFRTLTRMPANRDVEVGVGWRFQRRALGVGARQETTIWAAVDQPVDGSRRGVVTSPGAFAALVTGYASRSVYLWAGGAHRRYLDRGGSRPGDSTMASLVLGYRPGMFRRDYPSPDWRGFVEVVAEWMDDDIVVGSAVEGTGGRQVFVALTALGLYGWWGIAGGPALPLLQELDGAQSEDRLRWAVNLTFWW